MDWIGLISHNSQCNIRGLYYKTYIMIHDIHLVKAYDRTLNPKHH